MKIFYLITFTNLMFISACTANVEKNEVDESVLPIVGDSVPEYFKEQLAEKELLINNAISKSMGNYSAFVFFTDAHWGDNQKNSPSLINHIVKNTHINDVIFGGDVVTTYFDNPNDVIILGNDFRSALDKLNCNKYFLFGNHDDNSDHYSENSSRQLSEKYVYDYLQYGMSECTYGNYYNFFFDREQSKTRFICLDTGRYYYPELRGNILKTADFLINTLKRTPNDWRIILISHIWYDLAYDTPKVPYLPSYMKQFIDVLDNYNNCISGQFKYNTDTISYDFSTATSKIICCISGHCHLDALKYSESGIPIIITTTDSTQTVNNDSATVGTTDEQAVSVFVVNYSDSTINMIRIGRGNDLKVLFN